MSGEQSPDVIVVGAGVIGLAIADSLAEAGQKVLVLDRRDARAGGASVANAGWINPYTLVPLPSRGAVKMGLTSFAKPTSPLYIRPRLSIGLAWWLLGFTAASDAATFARGRAALVALGHDGGRRYLELEERLPGLRRNAAASLTVYSTPGGAAAAAAGELAEIAGAGPVPEHELLDGDGARAIEPMLGARAQSGLLVHGDLQIEPASILEVLAGSVLERGGRIAQDTEVLGLLRSGDRVTGVRTTAGEHRAGSVIIAAGAWSPELLAPLGVRLRMEPGKGYSVTLRVPTVPRQVLALGEVKVGAVPHGGRTRLVGTMELSGVNERVDDRRVAAIVTAARPYLRPLETADDPLALIDEVHVGMRPMFANGLPVIDRVADGLFVSTGHAMMGVTLALSSATALRDYLLEGRRPAVLEPFRLRRA